MVHTTTTADVQRSFGRCILSPGFLDEFYESFMTSSDEIRTKFKNTNFEKQKSLIKTGLSFMIMFADGRESAAIKLREIGKSHSSGHLDIPFWMFDSWKMALLTAVKKHDRKVTWELLEEWENVLQKGIDYIAASQPKRVDDLT